MSGGDTWRTEPLPVLRSPPDAPRLAGLEVGKLRVVGYGGSSGNPKGARWVCQCACGRYGYRRTATLRPDMAERGMCPQCHQAAQEAVLRQAMPVSDDPAADDAAALMMPQALARYLAGLAKDVGQLSPDNRALRAISVLASEIEWALTETRQKVAA